MSNFAVRKHKSCLLPGRKRKKNTRVQEDKGRNFVTKINGECTKDTTRKKPKCQEFPRGNEFSVLSFLSFPSHPFRSPLPPLRNSCAKSRSGTHFSPFSLLAHSCRNKDLTIGSNPLSASPSSLEFFSSLSILGWPQALIRVTS